VQAFYRQHTTARHALSSPHASDPRRPRTPREASRSLRAEQDENQRLNYRPSTIIWERDVEMEVDAAILLHVPRAIYYLMLALEKAFDLYKKKSDF